MTHSIAISRLCGRARRFWHDNRGTTLVEMAVVLPVFLLMLLGLIDFGRLGGEYVMAEKAMQRAIRIAAVRPAACAEVPQFNLRGTGLIAGLPPRFGTGCIAGANICINPGRITCTADITNATVAEVWTAVSPLLPTYATPANLQFSYTYDPNLGFLGGPYVPLLTLEIQNLDFQFATPLSALATLAAGPGNTAAGVTLPFPRMSTTIPAEDLASGNDG